MRPGSEFALGLVPAVLLAGTVAGALGCGGGKGGKSTPAPGPLLTNQPPEGPSSSTPAIVPPTEPRRHRFEGATYRVDVESSTTDAGAVVGVIRDSSSKEALVAATVVISGSNWEDQEVILSDEDGAFAIRSLRPGKYTLAVYYNEFQFSPTAIEILADKLVKFTLDWDVSSAGGEVETIDAVP